MCGVLTVLQIIPIVQCEKYIEQHPGAAEYVYSGDNTPNTLSNVWSDKCSDKWRSQGKPAPGE